MKSNTIWPLLLPLLWGCPTSPTPIASTPVQGPAASVQPSTPAPERAHRGHVRARGAADLEKLRGVTTLLGDLHLEGHGLQEASALESLHTIEGSVTVQGTALSDLSGLKALRLVHGRLAIERNSNLSSLKGLEALRTVASLRLERNPKLLSIQALSGLRALGFSIDIQGNDALPSLAGLQGLRALRGTLSLRYNAALSDISALKRLTSVGALRVEALPKLDDLSGLASLRTIRERLEMRGVPACAAKQLQERLKTKLDPARVSLDTRETPACAPWPKPSKTLRPIPLPPRHVARVAKKPTPYPARWIAEAQWREGLKAPCAQLAYKKDCASTREGIVRFELRLDPKGGVQHHRVLENTINQDAELVGECVEKAYQGARFAPPMGHDSKIELLVRLATKC